MKKAKIVGFILIILTFITLLLASCDKSVHSTETTYDTEANEQTSVDAKQCIHNYSGKRITEPTCIEDGVRKFTCSKCNDSYTAKIPATGHNYTENITTEATCTEDGIKTFTCSACNDSYTEKISATGHNWNNATCVLPKTCSVCNITEGYALGHTCKAGDCWRCGTTLYMEVKKPTVPITISYYGTTMRITSLSIGLSDNGRQMNIFFEAEKIYDSGGSNARNEVWFDYCIKDETGSIIASGAWWQEGYRVGDKFKGEEVIRGLNNTSEYYILEIYGE